MTLASAGNFRSLGRDRIFLFRNQGEEPGFAFDDRGKFGVFAPAHHIFQVTADCAGADDRVLQTQLMADVLELWIADARHDPLETEGTADETGDEVRLGRCW